MKKYLIAVIALTAFVAVSANASFDKNLSVGSTGTEVSALQTLLIGKGFAISAGATGYFGQQTKAAVVAYQASVKVPTTGFVGPLTRSALNGTSAVVANNPAFVCPVGMTCTTNPGTVTTPVVGTTGITTPGIPGTLVYSVQSTYNNSSLDKSKTVSVAKYKLQASASDMQVSSLSFDFDKRLWLYVGSVSIVDDNGVVVASKSGLTASDFSELTVGTKYRLTVPVSYLVPRATSKYLTLSLTALTSTDRTTSETITIVSSQARAVDGTGVTDTETDNTSGRTISWTGANNNNLVATIDSASPATKLVQISSSVETDNVVLGVFDIKSQNNDSRLRTLKVTVSADIAVSTLFNDVRIKIGGNTISADSISSSTSQVLTFSNIDTVLQKDTYVPVTILAKVAKNVSGTASVSITANNGNIVAEDSSFNTVSVTNSGAIASNAQTFTVSGVVSTNVGYVLDNAIAPDATAISRVAHVKYTLTAGDSAIYVSKTQTTAITATTTVSGSASISPRKITVDNTSGDTGSYFYVAPGQAKTFSADYEAAGISAAASNASMVVTSLNFGTTTSAVGGTLNSSDIQSALDITFF